MYDLVIYKNGRQSYVTNASSIMHSPRAICAECYHFVITTGEIWCDHRVVTLCAFMPEGSHITMAELLFSICREISHSREINGKFYGPANAESQNIGDP